jgi:hypothetical protein
MRARRNGSAGINGGSGKRIVQIFADERGFDDNPAVVIERRHDALGIDLEIFGLANSGGVEIPQRSSLMRDCDVGIENA